MEILFGSDLYYSNPGVYWQAYVIMKVADILVTIRHQAISNHHADSTVATVSNCFNYMEWVSCYSYKTNWDIFLIMWCQIKKYLIILRYEQN